MRRLFSLSAALIIGIMFAAGSAGVVLAQVTMTPLPSQTPAGRFMFSTVQPPRICGSLYVPCGPLPFRSLGFPTLELASSTPYPTVPTNTPVPITETPTPTYTNTPGGPTDIPPTATMTATQMIDLSGVNDLADGIEELGGTLSVQVTQVIMIDGTPMGIPAIAEKLAANISMPFSFIQGARQALEPFGMVGAIFNFLFFGMIFFLFIRVTLLFVPAFMGIFHLILKIIDVIIPF